jgi:hypothetical protein
MSLFHVNVRHGRTLDDARARLETAVNEVRARFGAMVQRVDWSPDRNGVTVAGGGFVVEMHVDAQDVHVTGDIPLLGALFGKPLEAGVKQIVQKTFGKD